MSRIRALQKKKTKDNILMLLNLMFKYEYRLNNGYLNKSKIAIELRIDVRTVRTHIKELQDKGMKI